MAEKDTDIGVHLSWVYSPIFDSKISDSILSITTIDGEKEFTNIKVSNMGGFFKLFKTISVRGKTVSWDDLMFGIKKNFSYQIKGTYITEHGFTRDWSLTFLEFNIKNTGYKINDNDLSTLIDFGTSYNAKEDFVSLLGVGYKSDNAYITAPKWNSQYNFEEQAYQITQYKNNNITNLKLIKKDCMPIQPNLPSDNSEDVSKWSRGKIFQNKWAHVEETYYIYKYIDSHENTFVEIKEEWKESENGKEVVKTNITQYAFETNNLILDIQAPGGKGADGSKDYTETAEGGGGGAFCRLIINLNSTNEEKPYILTVAACTTKDDQSPNYSEIGLKGGKKIRLQSGYNGKLSNPGEGGKIYIPSIMAGKINWAQLKPETNFNYKNFIPYYVHDTTGKVETKKIEDMIVLSYTAGKSQKEENFSSSDTLCNGTVDTIQFFNKSHKRGYAGKTMEDVTHWFYATRYGGGGGGASVLGYGQRGRAVNESVNDYDTDWFAYGGGGGGGVSDVNLTNNKKKNGTYGQPGCFIVYGLGAEIT